VLDRIAELVASLAAEAEFHRLASPRSAWAVPGLVDVARGITRFFPNLPTQWRDVPAAEILSGDWAVPCDC
jgi:glucokinase